MILIYMTTQAVLSDSRVIDIGSSLYDWVKRTSHASLGGETYRIIADQARRLSACTLTVAGPQGTRSGQLVNGVAPADQQDVLRQLEHGWINPDPVYLKDVHSIVFPDRAVLGDLLVNECRAATALSPVAVRALADNSLALDIHVMLAAQLPTLAHPAFLPWTELQARFGPGYKLARQFRSAFRQALAHSLSVYPAARVEVDGLGLTLFRSPRP